MTDSLLGQIKNYFVNLWTSVIKPDVQTAEQVAVAFFTAAINEAATVLGTVGLKIVTDGVQSAEAAGGTGTEKLAAATATITADLASASITAAPQVLNAAIEGAVAQLRVATTQAVSTATTVAANATAAGAPPS